MLNPAAIVKDGKVHLIYRSQDSLMTSRLALAVSEDEIHFEKTGQPIFFPENDDFNYLEWPGGVEDPRIVRTEDGGYFLTYTAYDGKTARLLSAYTKDLITFTKHGSVFKDPKYASAWSKSGAPVVRQEDNQFVMTRIDGYYYIYYGDTNLYLARSKTLTDWEVLEDAEKNSAIEALQPRPGYFDSRLVEPGHYALLTEDDIVMIYNASNAKNLNATELYPTPKLPSRPCLMRSNPVSCLTERTLISFTQRLNSTWFASSRGWFIAKTATYCITVRPIRAWAWRSKTPQKPLKSSNSRNLLILDDYLMQ